MGLALAKNVQLLLLLGEVNEMAKGTTMKDQGWYHTPAHRRWRKLILQRDKVCQHCKRKPATEAHHIKPLEDYPQLALELTNGQGLCWDCHELTKHKKKIVMPKGVRVIKA